MEWKTVFDDEVDTESLLHPEAICLSAKSQIDYTTTGMGVVWVVATAGEGLTARFNIRRLQKHAWPDSGQDKTFMLPETFCDLLLDPSKVKVDWEFWTIFGPILCRSRRT